MLGHIEFTKPYCPSKPFNRMKMNKALTHVSNVMCFAITKRDHNNDDTPRHCPNDEQLDRNIENKICLSDQHVKRRETPKHGGKMSN